MEGPLYDLLRLALRPADWLTNAIGLSERVPAIELAAGLVLLASAWTLAGLLFFEWRRRRTIIHLVTAVIALIGGFVGVWTSIAIANSWIYVVIISVVLAELVWRLLGRTNSRTLKTLGARWFTALLLLCAGTPTLYLLHSAWTEKQVVDRMDTLLAQEITRFTQTEKARIGDKIGTLAAKPQWDTRTVNNSQMLATLQQTAFIEGISYLLLLTPEGKVVARTQPAGAAGDQWPVKLPISETSGGITLSERSQPLAISLKATMDGGTLVAGQVLDQNYVSTRFTETSQPLFILEKTGITGAVGGGIALNAVTAASVDAYLAKSWDHNQTARVQADGKGFLVRTRVVVGSDGSGLASLGTISMDSNPDQRLRLDLLFMIAIVVLYITIPTFLHQRRESNAI